MSKPPAKPSAAKKTVAPRPAAKAAVPAKATIAKTAPVKSAVKPVTAKEKAAPVKAVAAAKLATPASTRAPVVKAARSAALPKAKPAPAAKPQPQPQAQAKPAESARPKPQPEMPRFDNENMRQLETLSVNLAKAAMTAQSALAKTVFKQPDTAAGTAPMDPFQVAPAMTEIMNSLVKEPHKLLEAQSELMTGYFQLWGDMSRKMLMGGAAPAAAKPDKRFADPRWEQNLMFDMMKQSYLLSSNWINKLISSAEGVDPKVKRRAEFFTKLLTDAMSPSNFLMSNPAALQTLMDTNGESLVKGMEKFAEDIERGDGKLMISQADYSRFKVGENVAKIGRAHV